jgi:dTDP-4-amino-4,6-dideoxygalactose transaminase
MHGQRGFVLDAAQTLQPLEASPTSGYPDFVSLSFQASKILALGEGGALLTNDEELASRARSYLSLGYAMGPSQARIDSPRYVHPPSIVIIPGPQ